MTSRAHAGHLDRRARRRRAGALVPLALALVLPAAIRPARAAAATVAKPECSQLPSKEADLALEQKTVEGIREALDATAAGDTFITGGSGPVPGIASDVYATPAKVDPQRWKLAFAAVNAEATNIIAFPAGQRASEGNMFVVDTLTVTDVLRRLVDSHAITALDGGRVLAAFAKKTGVVRGRLRKELTDHTKALSTLTKAVAALRAACPTVVAAPPTACLSAAWLAADPCATTTTVPTTAPRRGYTLRSTVPGKVPATFENGEVRISGSISPTSLSISSEMKPPYDGVSTIADTWSTPPAMLVPGDVIELTCTVAATTTGKDARTVASSCGWDATGAVKIVSVTKAFGGMGSDGKFYANAAGSLRIEVLPGGTGVTLTAYHVGAYWGEGITPPAVYTYSAA